MLRKGDPPCHGLPPKQKILDETLVVSVHFILLHLYTFKNRKNGRVICTPQLNACMHTEILLTCRHQINNYLDNMSRTKIVAVDSILIECSYACLQNQITGTVHTYICK